MPNRFTKITALFLCLLLVFEQSGFAQIAGQLDISSHLLMLRNSLAQDKFRPLHLRYLQYLPESNNFKLLLDKGDALRYEGRGKKEAGQIVSHPSSLIPRNEAELQAQTKQLLSYFFIGLTLPNDTFWVNLRPDSPDNIIDDTLAQTDIGKILLEADLQLKKDTSLATSPETPEGKLYWDKLYKKAEELFGYENITIPTLTRPWIVPGEIIMRETRDEGRGTQDGPSAYIYKATLKVMLEEDYLRGTKDEGRWMTTDYTFNDPRLKALNEYSTQLIQELIIPKLTKDLNSSKRYAPLRQVYYSLILAQWFKARFRPNLTNLTNSTNSTNATNLSNMIDSRNLTSLTSKTPYSKDTYFNEYKRSFSEGEYNLKEPVYTPYGQSIRSYMSGGIALLGDKISAVSSVVGAKKELPRSLLENNKFRLINIPGVFLSGNYNIPEGIEEKGELPAASPLGQGKGAVLDLDTPNLTATGAVSSAVNKAPVVGGEGLSRRSFLKSALTAAGLFTAQAVAFRADTRIQPKKYVALLGKLKPEEDRSYDLWIINLLKHYFSFNGISLEIVDNAIREDLKNALKDPAIDGVIVVGHGFWEGWSAVDGFVREDDLKEWKEEWRKNNLQVRLKEKFYRYTCGNRIDYSSFGFDGILPHEGVKLPAIRFSADDPEDFDRASKQIDFGEMKQKGVFSIELSFADKKGQIIFDKDNSYALGIFENQLRMAGFKGSIERRYIDFGTQLGASMVADPMKDVKGVDGEAIVPTWLVYPELFSIDEIKRLGPSANYIEFPLLVLKGIRWGLKGIIYGGSLTIAWYILYFLTSIIFNIWDRIQNILDKRELNKILDKIELDIKQSQFFAETKYDKTQGEDDSVSNSPPASASPLGQKEHVEYGKGSLKGKIYRNVVGLILSVAIIAPPPFIRADTSRNIDPGLINKLVKIIEESKVPERFFSDNVFWKLLDKIYSFDDALGKELRNELNRYVNFIKQAQQRIMVFPNDSDLLPLFPAIIIALSDAHNRENNPLSERELEDILGVFDESPKAEKLLQQAYELLAKRNPVAAIESYNLVKKHLPDAELSLKTIVESVARNYPGVMFGLFDFLKGHLPNAELFLSQLAWRWAQEDPLGALRSFDSYKHLINAEDFLQQAYETTIKLVSQGSYDEERLSGLLNENADLRDYFLRFLDKAVEKFAQPASVKPEDFNTVIFALQLKDTPQTIEAKSRLVKIISDFAIETNNQELRILYLFSILNGIERMDSDRRDFLNRQYPEIMRRLEFLKPKESLPYKEIFGPKNPDKQFNIRAYIPLHPHFYKEMFVNELGLTQEGEGDRVTFSGMLNGKKVTIYLDSSGDPKDYQEEIFKDMANPDIHWDLYSGHTGMGAALSFALDKAPPVDRFESGTKLIGILSCDSARVYAEEVRRLYPYSQGIYFDGETNTGEIVTALKETILGITREEKWPQIEDKVKEIDPTIKLLLPHKSRAGFLRQGYYIPASGVMLLTENDVFNFDPAYIDLSNIVSTKAEEVIQKALYFFHWNSALKAISEDIEAGGFAQPLADEQGVFLIAKKKGEDGRDKYAVTLNVGYRNSSKAALAMMLLYELNEYISGALLNKDGAITVFDKLRGLQLAAEFAKTHHKEHLFPEFLKKYGYLPENVPLELLQKTLDTNDNATRTKALNELLKKMDHPRSIEEKELKSQGLLSYDIESGLRQIQIARSYEINGGGYNFSESSASPLGQGQGRTGGKGWVIALTAMLIGAIFYPAGISKEPTIEQPRIIEAQKEPLDTKIQKRVDHVTNFVLHRTPLAAKQAFREAIRDVKKHMPYLAEYVSETDLRIIAGIEDKSGSIESRASKNTLGPMQIREIAFKDLLLFIDTLEKKVKKGTNSKGELNQHRFFKKIKERYGKYREVSWEEAVKKMGLRGNYEVGAAVYIKNLIAVMKTKESSPELLSALPMKHSAAIAYNAGRSWIFRWPELPADTKDYLKIIEEVKKNIGQLTKIPQSPTSSSSLASSSPVYAKEEQTLQQLDAILTGLIIDPDANLEAGKEVIGLFNQLSAQERIRIFGKILKDGYELEKKEADKLFFPFGYNLWKDIADKFSYAFSDPEELPLLAALLNSRDIPDEDKVYVWKILERFSGDNPLKVQEALDTGGISANQLIAMAMAPAKKAGAIDDIAANIVSKLLNTRQERAVVIARQYAHLVLSLAQEALRHGRVFDSRLIEQALALFEPLSASEQIPLRQQATEEVIKIYIDQLIIINDIFQEGLKAIHQNPDISYAEFYERLMGGASMQERLAYLTSRQRVMIKSALMQSRLDRLVWRNEFEQARRDYPIDEFSRLSLEINGLYKQRIEFTRAHNKAVFKVNLSISALEARLFKLRKAVGPYLEKTFGIAAKDAPYIAVIKLGDFGPEAYLDSQSLQKAVHSKPETPKDAASDTLKRMKASLVKDKTVNKEALYSLLKRFASYVFADLQDEMTAHLVGAMLRYRDFDEQVLNRYMSEYLDALREYIQKEDWFKRSGLTENDIIELINEIRLDPESKWQRTRLVLKETKHLLDDLVDAKATLIYYETQRQNPDLAGSQELKDKAYEQASFYILGIFQLVPILKTYRLKGLLARLRKDLAEKGIFGKDILRVAVTQSKKPYEKEDFVWVGFAKGNAIVAEIGSEQNVIRHEWQHLIFNLYTGKEARRLTPGFNNFVRIMQKAAAEENNAQPVSLPIDAQNGPGYDAEGLSASPLGQGQEEKREAKIKRAVEGFIADINGEKTFYFAEGGIFSPKGMWAENAEDFVKKTNIFLFGLPVISRHPVIHDDWFGRAITEMLTNAYDAIVSVYDPAKGPKTIPQGYKGAIKLSFAIESYPDEQHKALMVLVSDNGLGDKAADTQRKKEAFYAYIGGARNGLSTHLETFSSLAKGAFFLRKAQYNKEFTGEEWTEAALIIPLTSLTQKEGLISSPVSMKTAEIQGPGGIGISARQADKAQAPLGINSPINKETGGIDLRALPIAREPILESSSPALSPQHRALNPVLGNEWGKIQSMLNAGIIPSGQRLVGYISSCLKDGVYIQESDKILGSVADILRIQEEKMEPTENGFSSLLILLESDKPAQELELALSAIEFAPKEPKAIEPK